MVQRALFPLDGSHPSEAALRFAGTLHRAFNCHVVLLRVVEAGQDSAPRFSGSVEWRFREAEARGYLAKVRDRLMGEGIDAEVLVSSGNPAREILRAAGRLGADLVVVTGRGEGNGGASGVGGTAHHLISAAETSILLVRDPVRGEAGDPDGKIRRVVVPVDGSSRGDWALSLAASLADASGATLELLHVVQRPGNASPLGRGVRSSPADGWVELQRENGELELEERRRRLAALSAPVRAEVMVATSVPRAIAAAATEGPESLLVVSAHGQSGASGWPYGSTVSSLLSHGRTSILVFQDLPRRSERPASAGSGRIAAQRQTVSRPRV